MLIVQNQMPLQAIVRSWTLLAALRAAHELLVIIITSEMQSIRRAKHTVLMVRELVTGSDPMATYHFAIVFIGIN